MTFQKFASWQSEITIEMIWIWQRGRMRWIRIHRGNLPDEEMDWNDKGCIR
jgi:hypothetical protein